MAGVTNAFGFDLYRQLSGGDDNLAISPASIGITLNMLRVGARSDTARQLEQALHVTLPEARSHAALGGLAACYGKAEEPQPYELLMSNRLFVHRESHLRSDFQATLQKYAAGAEAVDFVGSTESSRQHINSWVAEQTQQHIRDLMPKDSVTSDTRLVLTNAVYFKGKWQAAFPHGSTQDQPFKTPRGVKQVPTMALNARLKYAETDDLQLVNLPYQGERFSMTLLVPKQPDGLKQLTKNLNSEALERWLGQANDTKVRLWLPRFTIKPKGSVRLKDPLRGLGVIDAFDARKANLSGIFGDQPYAVSDVYHQSFVEVNEDGTEAAAATGAGIIRLSLPPPQPEIRADHPFLFLIRDVHTGFILFMGQVADPT
ncbi:MAG: serpin family protein [Polyangiaceae bacterium]